MNLTEESVRGQLREAFLARFGGAGPLRCALAPGRVNLIGEHTDYNGGFVLPIAIPRHTAVTFRPNAQPRIAVHSADVAQSGGQADDEFGLTLKDTARRTDAARHWTNYARGVAAALLRRGVRLKGGDLYVTADLPMGAGLSSSASLEVAVALALLALARRTLPPQELALACQAAEHSHAGVRCGIMDQTVVARAKAGCALLLDCHALTVRHVPVRLAGWNFAVFDTGVKHSLAAGEYNKRRAECEHAAKLLGAKTLRGVSIEDLLRKWDKLTAGEWRRARHVASENLRALAFAGALVRGDAPALGRLLNEGHRSLAQDYEVSCAELEALAAALTEPAPDGAVLCAGARITGGGFGGSIVALVKEGRFSRLRDLAAQRYEKACGRKLGSALSIEPAPGAGVVRL